MLTVEQINDIVAEAHAEASAAAQKFFQEKLGGVDQYACGFAWVEIYRYNGKKLDGRTKMGKLMKQADIIQHDDYRKCYRMRSTWNPGVQNVDTLYAGAKAAAEVFKRHGFDASAADILD